MAKLTHYHLTHRNDQWRLEKDGSDRATVKARTKKEAIKKMRAKVKGMGASVTIHRLDGSIQEEWTYPRRADVSETKKASRSGSANTKAKAVAEEAKEEAKSQTLALAEEPKQQAQSQLATQKARATGSLRSLSTVLQDASSQLREENQDVLARYADTAAEQLGQFAELLGERSVSELLREAERYARREPALFLGGAMVLGFFGGRFLKSSRS